ncbi:MAG: uridine kinase [Actinomycetota bacterium]|nr:uridine kinase [Actinomycetota bacterium]
MTPRRVSQTDAIAEAVRVAGAGASAVAWIGVDGPGGAGKSTLARRIADAIPRAAVVSVDDFWGPSIAEWDWDRFLAQVARPLCDGHDARYQEWDWVLDAGGPWHDIAAGSVVVLEGVSATRNEVDVPWALRIWVETPPDVRLARALERDGAALMPRWFDDWIPSEQAYIADQRPRERVDLVVSGVEER